MNDIDHRRQRASLVENMHEFRPFSGRDRNQQVRTAYLILMMETSFGVRR